MFGADWLGQEIVATGIQGLIVLVDIAFAGQKHDRRVQELIALANQGRQLGAVAIGHVQIHQHQVGAELIHGVQHFEGVADHLGFHAGIAQD